MSQFYFFFSRLIAFVLWINIDVLVYEYEFLLGSSLSIGVSLIIDKIGVRFSCVVLLIAGCVFTFAHSYIREDPFKERFLWILFTFVLRMNFLVYSNSLLFLLLGWDGLGISSFALIIYYQSKDRVLAGFQTLIVNRVGDSLIILATYLFVLNHQFVIGGIGAVIILAVAANTKSAQYPFSSWLPAAIAAPTPVRALVHSSTLVTAGIFLIIRIRTQVLLSEQVKCLFLLVGSLTCLLGGWAAFYENDLKKVIALSTLSQLGIMVFRLGLGLTGLALFHLYSHALFKALLFLVAGQILISSYGAQDLRLLATFVMRMPFTVVCFNISSLCLIRAPFLSSFYSKHLILEMLVRININLFSVLTMFVATILTRAYVVRSLKRVCWGTPQMPLISSSANSFTSFPVFLLGLGRILGGKFYSIVHFPELCFPSIRFFWGIVINVLGLRGAIMGWSVSSPKKRFFGSFIFWLVPSLSPKRLIVTNNLKELEYGWLEPKFYLANTRYPEAFTKWPNKWPLISLLLVMGLAVLLFYCKL